MDAPVAIVGGGISGLSAAYYLAKAGIPSVILEARPRLGGVIQSERVERCVIEGGPDSFLSTKPAAMELIVDLGTIASASPTFGSAGGCCRCRMAYSLWCPPSWSR